MEQPKSRIAVRSWLVPLCVSAFALMGVAASAAYYFVPPLKSSRIVSFLIPVQVTVDPAFDGKPHDLDMDSFQSVVVWNALVYALVGLFMGVVMKFLYKSRFVHHQVLRH